MQKTILLIDDEQKSMAALQEEFQVRDFAVDIAVNFAEAQQKLQDNNYELIITDLKIDDTDGLEILKQTKRNYHEVSLIILTNKGDLSTAIEALRLGAEDYIIKPCEFSEIFSRVSTIFDKKFLRREIDEASEENMHMAAALIERERDLQIMTNFAYDWVYWVDPDENYKYMSLSCERITGYTVEEFMKHNKLLYRICVPEDRQKIVNHKVADSQDKHSVHNVDFRIITKDGKTRWLNHICQPLYNEKGRYLGRRASNHDITNRKNMEEELLKAKKIQATATLAGGIAHDYNNLLTAILGNLDLAKLVLEQGGDIRAFLNNAEQASYRAKDLTQKFLTFSKGGAPVKQVTEIDKTLREAVELSLTGTNIKHEFIGQEEPWFVEADLEQLTQVVTNIITNSQEAMPDGGMILVKVEQLESLKDERDHVTDLPDQRYLKISFKDQGTGISKENVANIFDPYFSTKERGEQKGMGLGLAIVHSIITRHGGGIGVESNLDEGTNIIIYLPVAEQNKALHAGLFSTGKAGRKNKILIMDDEELVRSVVGSMVQLLGYDVYYARDGAEAIEIYQEELKTSRPIDLLIMDLTIPAGMGGKEAVQKINQINPAAKVIVSSGYSNDQIMKNYQEYGFCAAIIKPYQIQELKKVLNKFCP